MAKLTMAKQEIVKLTMNIMSLFWDDILCYIDDISKKSWLWTIGLTRNPNCGQ
jgi:hypothetical protein